MALSRDIVERVLCFFHEDIRVFKAVRKPAGRRSLLHDDSPAGGPIGDIGGFRPLQADGWDSDEQLGRKVCETRMRYLSMTGK